MKVIQNKRVKKSMKVVIKFPLLRRKREKVNDTSLDWLMFQNIYLMYHKINNEEARNSVMHLTSMSYTIQDNKKGIKLKITG